MTFRFFSATIIILFIHCLLACSSKESDTDSTCLGEKNILISCITVYDPVCGCDGKTYSNSCIAEAEGVLRWQAGECN